MKIETLLAHLNSQGGVKDPHGSSHFPIYQTATFDLKKQNSDEPYIYSRVENPTRLNFEQVLAKAEKAAGVVCTNSGVSAIHLMLDAVLKTGSHIVVERDLYGGTLHILNDYKARFDLQVTFVDFTQRTELEKVLSSSKVDLVHCESPTNPGLKVLDLADLANLTHQYNALFSVDNSMATFYGQQPLALGADLVVCSSTKYISGHGAVLSGYVATKTEEHLAIIKNIAFIYGRTLSPQDVHTISLGLPTLAIRMQRHQETALELAKFLQALPVVREVKFPLLPDNPYYEITQRQMRAVPGVILVHFDTVETAEKLIARAKLFGEKASFGTPDSRMEIPSKLSHASYTEEELDQIGLLPSSVRISVGLEDIEDLKNDIIQALA